MNTFTQLLLGMATAGVAAGPQRPTAFVAGAVAGVLPDAIDWWLRQLVQQPDITVTPDPLAPDPATVAQGVRLALQHVRFCGRSCVVRFNPLPAPNGGYIAYRLDCDRQCRLVVSLGGKPAPVDPPDAVGAAAAIFLPLHPLPLRITDTPVDLRLGVMRRRIESRDLDRMTTLGHSLSVAGALAILAGVINFWIGVAAATALVAHLLIEIGGRRDVAIWLPFSGPILRGRRLWNERDWHANLCAGALAGAIVAAVVLAGR